MGIKPEQSQKKKGGGEERRGETGRRGTRKNAGVSKMSDDPLAGRLAFSRFVAHNVVTKVHTGKCPNRVKRNQSLTSVHCLVLGTFVASLSALLMGHRRDGTGATKPGFFSSSGFRKDMQGYHTAQPLEEHPQQDEPPRLPMSPNTSGESRGHGKRQEVRGTVVLS